METQKQRIELKKYEDSVHKRFRNYKWILCGIFAGVSLLFIALTLSYYISHDKQNQVSIRFTPLTYINTFILLFSSILIELAHKQFFKNNYRQYKRFISGSIALGILFITSQIISCVMMYVDGQTFSYNSASYFYIIAGIHNFFISLGLITWCIHLVKHWNILSNYATSFVYFTDSIAKSKLNLFTFYWHFLGIIWLYLLLFFLAIK